MLWRSWLLTRLGIHRLTYDHRSPRCAMPGRSGRWKPAVLPCKSWQVQHRRSSRIQAICQSVIPSCDTRSNMHGMSSPRPGSIHPARYRPRRDCTERPKGCTGFWHAIFNDFSARLAVEKCFSGTWRRFRQPAQPAAQPACVRRGRQTTEQLRMQLYTHLCLGWSHAGSADGSASCNIATVGRLPGGWGEHACDCMPRVSLTTARLVQRMNGVCAALLLPAGGCGQNSGRVGWSPGLG